MPPDPELARRSHDILTRAMGLARAQRRDFARTECAGDDALVRRVLALLDAADTADGAAFLDRPLIDATAACRPPSHELPDAIGTYLVVGVLGVGGMATVYEAIQEQPARRVALKVMHRSLGGTDGYRRFRFETEALARLQHPGIAQIFEAGIAQLDQPEPAPFFAMELVPDATPITRYAAKGRLPLRQRLAMLADVCDAVHHGHQHGIIHRDLKPANVLVGADGRIKVIDFGVARSATGTSRSPTTITGQPQLVGTLNYMSPEQCTASADIDTRTDVYALGVILYELVCGELPHDLSGLPIPAAIRRIVEEPPHPPRLPPGRSQRDLAAIIEKAIGKQPSDRYQSAAAFAADIRRFLADQPTEARPPRVRDHVRLFARRHRALVAGAAAIAAAVVLVATVSTAFAIRLNQEVDRRRIAEQQTRQERDRARWEAYIAQIASAFSAMKTGEFQQMRSRLAAAAYQPRGWEWGFLSRLAERSASTINAHDGRIMGVAIDGDRLVTTSSDGVVRLASDNGAAEIARHRTATGAQVVAALLTSGGIVIGDDDGVLRRLDDTMAETAALQTPGNGPIRSLIQLADGEIAAASASGDLYLTTPRLDALPTPAPRDQPGGIHGLALSADRSLLATFNEAGVVWIRRADDFSRLHDLRFPGHINEARFSHDGRLLAAAGEGGVIRIWRTDTGESAHDLRATKGVNTVRSIAFSHDGSMLAVGLVHRGILVYALDDGSVIGKLGGHTDAVSALWFDPDDRILTSASWDGSIRSWPAAEFASPAGITTLDGASGFIYATMFTPDGGRVVSAGDNGSLIAWDPDRAVETARIRGSASIAAIDIVPDGSIIAAASTDRALRLLDGATLAEIDRLEVDGSWLASVVFDTGASRLAGGAQDGTIRIWSIADRKQTHVLLGHSARVNSVRFSPDGGTIASGSRDGTVRLWNAATGAPLAVMEGHSSDVFTVRFNHDGTRLFSGSRDQTVRVWDTATGARVAVLAGHGQPVTCLAINPGGTRLASGSWYGEVVLFDLATLDQVASFRAHDAAIRGIAFSPDGRWLATGSYDGTVRLFDSATREEARAARLAAESR